jgi:CO/xanthine dehydrogenase Mo-binding subunit
MGTYGSRSLAVGGTAIVKALDKIIAKGKKIAAHLMEAADSRHRVRGRRVQGGRHRQDKCPSARSRSRPTCRTTTRSTSSSRA